LENPAALAQSGEGGGRQKSRVEPAVNRHAAVAVPPGLSPEGGA
jgi:hypothetical protein